MGKFLFHFAFVLAASWRARARSRNRPLAVFFTPQTPRPWYVIWTALALSGVRIAASADTATAIFYFDDATFGAPPSATRAPNLNGAVRDISKSYVASAFERVAGYRLAIDPATFVGVAVAKGEQNGTHDGRLVTCPCVPIEDTSYQRFIDSGVGDMAIDYRVSIVSRRVQCVIEKRKSASARFSIHNASVRLLDLTDVFSNEERALLNEFADEMQLDWAAIDVLRDRTDGRIYVVDVNTTDTGPAVDLSRHDRKRLNRALSNAFLEMICSMKATGRPTHADHFSAIAGRSSQSITSRLD